ncbi:MAG: GatB/YqeY domain-containing protein [Nitriliruptorales bacterium]
MSLQQQIQADLTAAMKARDRERTSALRMIVAEMKNEAVAQGLGPQGELPDEAVERILTRETKRRREAADSFRDAGREDRAASEESDAEVYASYLPEQLGDDELLELIDAAITEVGPEGPGDMGKVMGAVMGHVGNRADGKRVSAAVKSRLMD